MILAALLAVAVSPYSTDIPPPRFRGDVNARIEFIRPTDVEVRCQAIGFSLKLRVNDTLLACARNSTIVIPNPCLYAEYDGYAKLLCHEIGHVNGWPETHGQ